MQPSRSSEVDMDKCIEAVGGNTFQMILIAAERAREIASRRKNDTSNEVNNPVITTLLEIQNNKIDPKQLKRFQ